MSDLIGPDFITFQVRDLEASRHFYSEVIGLKVSPEVRPNAVAYATKPIGMAIRKSLVDLGPVKQPEFDILLWFRTENAAELLGQLKEKNVPIVQELADSPFGKMFAFQDPDGYVISVHDGG
jgi:predicted enzyme related to lactoylglutathione lyase